MEPVAILLSLMLKYRHCPVVGHITKTILSSYVAKWHKCTLRKAAAA